ncbi:MAG: hypothetical protein ASARMPREDX12_004730 [Alectoria sarmentosa]|nr:MAG: hypothetical protein ASARMPREDX12_004730 [Alectoria sarmentosa]
MAPHAESVTLNSHTSAHTKKSPANVVVEEKGPTGSMNDPPTDFRSSNSSPLKLTGILNQFKSFDVTPVIGKEFPEANLAEWLRAPNSDQLLKDLAITISQRGVVFFRAQDGLDNGLQKELLGRLGELSGKPKSSKMYIEPTANDGTDASGDLEINTISSRRLKKIFPRGAKVQSGKGSWHSDATFEKVTYPFPISPGKRPSLRLVEIPSTGGDTIWASGYELYDRISEPYQKFLEGLTVTFAQPKFNEVAKMGGFKLYSDPRGSPLNVGELLQAVHPVVRTNPVTGWKSVFAVGVHVQHINDVTPLESKALQEWFMNLIVENQDLQVRLRWQNANDLAIWDNRSTYHTATSDYYDDPAERMGRRAISVGEKPFFDVGSKSRREALWELATAANGHGEKGAPAS